MIELFGFELGSVFQGGTLAALLVLIAGVATVFIKGIPDRLRATNEGKAINNAELALRYKAWRTELHDLKNETTKVMAEQLKCSEALATAHALNRPILFLIRLMIREVKRLDPASPIVSQAETTMELLGQALDNPAKSGVLIKAAVEEVKRAENGKEGK